MISWIYFKNRQPKPMKKRSKVSAEFSMSSLTDIIFLLLIFFMLTSSTVQINMELAESNSTTLSPSDLVVMMTKDGRLTFNGKTVKKSELKGKIKTRLANMENKDNASLAIIAEVDVPWKKINDAMKVANSLQLKAHIATQPIKK